MGIRVFGSTSSSSYDKCKSTYTLPPKLPNPDPLKWIIRESVAVGKHLVLHINYPDCTNYEGDKILVYRNTTIEQLLIQKTIDPHFSYNKKFISPFARFEPTQYGWECAVELVESIL